MLGLSCFIFTTIIFFQPNQLTAQETQQHKINSSNHLRGWKHLADILIQRGNNQNVVEKLFLDKRMPEFTELFFSVIPRESPRLYTSFYSPKRLKATREYLKTHAKYFSEAEQKYGIDRRIIAAILLVETGFGKITGKETVVYRLARLANASDPQNLINNHARLKKIDKSITFKQVKDRGKYLEDLFAEQVEAAIKIAQQQTIDVFSIKGSSAGAFGYSQFLPLSYLRFAVDGNKDGTISLYQHGDAIHSIANFLSHYRNLAPEGSDSLRAAIWEYNRSDPYIDTIIGVAKKMGYIRPKTAK